MRKLYIYITVIVLLGAIGWTSYGQRQISPKVTWEYMSLSGSGPAFKGDATLNELGLEGWELTSVAAFSPAEGYGGGGIIFYFKRAR